MNVFTALKGLEPPLIIDSREIIVNYCVDSENKQISDTHPSNNSKLYDSALGGGGSGGGSGSSQYGSSVTAAAATNYRYTLADVPRLAEYSAGVYAQTTAEYEHYYRYYTEFYTTQINAGQFSNLPTINQIGGGDTANSGAAVALSAIQRKLQKQGGNSNGKIQHQFAPVTVATATTPAVAEPVHVPNGTDGRVYREY